MPEGRAFLRSQFTGPVVARWLAALPWTGDTQRRYFAGMQSFVKYLRQVGVLTDDPLRDVTPPRAAPPRCVFFELPSVIRLVEGSDQPYRAIFALAYGAGLEISAILALTENDVDRAARAVRAAGTKAWCRDRISYIADWAWPHIEEHVNSLTPGERLFRGVTRWAAGDSHRSRLRALGLVGYTLHKARNHWAVAQIRPGVPVELVARQLGHRDAVMALKVYGRFVPRTQEWNHWRERVRAAQAEKWGIHGTKRGTAPEPVQQAPADDAALTFDGGEGYDDSRGGTRTRDPGIMSAVL